MDKADQLLNQGDVILGKASTVDGFNAWYAVNKDSIKSVLTDASLAPLNITLQPMAQRDGVANNPFYVAS